MARIWLFLIVIVFLSALLSGLIFLHSNREEPPYTELFPPSQVDICEIIFSCTCLSDFGFQSVILFEEWKDDDHDIEAMFQFCLLDVMGCSCSKPASEWKND